MKLALVELYSITIKQSPRALVSPALCVAFILGCGSDRTETRTAPIQTSPSYTPASDDATVSVATPPLAAPPLVPTPTPGPPRSASTAPYSPVAPSLDENIFHADVIAWARPPAVTGKSKTIPSEDGVAPTYRPFIEFRFEVVEYLKGSGGPRPRKSITSRRLAQEPAHSILAMRTHSRNLGCRLTLPHQGFQARRRRTRRATRILNS